MTPAEAVVALDAIEDDDPETAHVLADSILHAVIPKEVRDAYGRVVDRTGAWWYA